MKERIFKLKEFEYDELSEGAKKNAYREFINDNNKECAHLHWVCGDMQNTMEAFSKVFDVELTDWEVDFSGSYHMGNVKFKGVWNYYDEEVYESMTGVRLIKFIQNNFGKYLTKGKYYSKPQYTDEGKYLCNFGRRSKVIMTRDCVLTGMCYDMDILKPVYEFLEGKLMYITYYDLFEECFRNLLKVVAEECEYFWTEEYFVESYAELSTYNEDGSLFSVPSNSVEVFNNDNDNS